MRVRVELLPDLAPGPDGTPRGWPRDAHRWAAVAIDVLRATTTLTVTLRNGARGVVPAATPREALALARDRSPVLLCGEREGRRIEGFDLGNSPAEYGPDVVGGRDLVFASTNGSLALRAISGCGVRLMAGFVNATAVLHALTGRSFVLLVCAGRLGRFALEDAALAGWLVERLVERGARAEGAAAAFTRALAPRDAAQARALVQGSVHGRYLRSLGPEYARDVEFCAGLDTVGEAFGL